VSTDDSDSPVNDATREVGESSGSSTGHPINTAHLGLVDPEDLPSGWRQTIPDDPNEPPRWVPPQGGPTLGSQAASTTTGEWDEEPPAIAYAGRQVSGPYTGVAHPVTGQTLRAWLTIGLTVAVITVVLTAVIMRLPPGDFAQYVSPLTGLAGLALGYWFGTERNN
jgi:hypothetical protein